MQILALLPGISRDGIVMVSGMFRGLSAGRGAVLLPAVAPVILAAGVLKIPDLTGPLGARIRGQVIFGSAAVLRRRLPRAQVPGPLLQQPRGR